MAEAILLENRPISGAYPEQWFDARGECTSILFEDDNYEKWLGVFGNAQITQYCAAFLFPGTSNVLESIRKLVMGAHVPEDQCASEVNKSKPVVGLLSPANA